MNMDEFKQFVAQVSHAVLEALKNSNYPAQLQVPMMRDSIELYIKRGGKRMRPSLLAISYMMFGGDNIFEVSPACLAVELYHCWTLVHDDIIDNDSLRRGGATVHAHFMQPENLIDIISNQPLEVRELFGRDVAIFAGDIMHAWAIDSFLQQAEWGEKYWQSIFRALQMLERKTVCALADGEIIDRMLAYKSWDKITEAEILNMLELKTARLLQFCGFTGAIFANPELENNNPQLKAIENYLKLIGLAFQLKDDLLGAFGNEAKLGKPIGSDFREGKRTQLLLYTWQMSSEKDRIMLNNTLGNPAISLNDVEKIQALIVSTGAKDRSEKYLNSLIEQAKLEFNKLPDNHYRQILQIWSDLAINRDN